MNRNNVIIVAILLFAVTALGVWLYQNLIYETEYVQTQGYSSEARENSFLAAERLLNRLDREAHSVRKVSQLPTELDPADSLILSTPGYALSSKQVDDLLAWVEQGGHLLLATYRTYDLDADSGVNKLFDYLGLSVDTWSDADDEETEEIKEIFGFEEEQPDTITLPNITEPLKVRFYSRYFLQDADGNAAWAISDRSGTRLLHYQQGQGAITVLSELRLFQNRRLARHDHANLLWQLVQLNDNTGAGTVWLQYAPQVASLLELLWRNAWMPLLGLTLTLIAILWAANRRLGPKLLSRSEARRSLLEHIQASGRFLWRQKDRATLLSAVRQRTQQALRRRHPHWRTLDIPAQAEHLARLLDLPKAEIEAALADNTISDRQLFTRRIQQLQQLAKKS